MESVNEPFLALSLMATLLFAQSAAAFGDQVLDVRGKWAGKNYAIVAGSGAHWPANGGDFTKSGLSEKDVAWEIKGQDGRRFWGITILTTSGKTTSEPFLGQLTGDKNKKIILVDTDGYVHGELIGNDKISGCYEQAGGPYKQPGFNPVIAIGDNQLL